MCTHGGIFAKIPPSQHSGLAERDSLAHPAQHVGGTVLRHDPHDDPSHSLQQLERAFELAKSGSSRVMGSDGQCGVRGYARGTGQCIEPRYRDPRGPPPQPFVPTTTRLQ